jgi:BirA family transcriptional regulator, biotin operon repressor / biotin---[acetyl-CoA-carboxylase] ligase
METLFVGRNIIFLPEIDSTNSYASTLLKNVNVAEGTLVYAAKQTMGRGQRGNPWTADAQCNLTASIVLKPGFLDLKKHFYLYQISALACYDVMAEILDSSQFDIKIKWPNDLLINTGKIAGILIENNILNSRIQHSIIGIGINVNQAFFEPGMNAVSLKTLSGMEHDIQSILEKLCRHLEKYYLLLKNDETDKLTEKYLSHFFRRGEWQDFMLNGEITSLRIKGIASGGMLSLEDSSGKNRDFDVKELKWLL